MITPEQYASLNNIPQELCPLLGKLHRSYWTWLKGKKLKDGIVIISTGYYAGSGKYAQKQSVAKPIKLAAEQAGFHVELFNDAPRGGILGEKLRISITKPEIKPTGLMALNNHLNQ